MNERNCSTCRHLLNRSDEQRVGQCTRFPPTPIVVGIAQAPGNTLRMQPAAPQPIIQAPFPVMNFDMTCGEYASETNGQVLNG